MLDEMSTMRGVAVDVRGGPALKEVRGRRCRCKGRGLVLNEVRGCRCKGGGLLLMIVKFDCGTCLEVMVLKNPSMECVE